MEERKLVLFKSKEYAEEYFNKLFHLLNLAARNEQLKKPINIIELTISSEYYYEYDTNNKIMFISPLVVSYNIEDNNRLKIKNYSVFNYINERSKKSFSIKDIEDDFKERFEIYKNLELGSKEFLSTKKLLSKYINFILSYHFWNDDIEGMLKMKECFSQIKDEYSFKLDKQSALELSLLIKRKNAPVMRSPFNSRSIMVRDVLGNSSTYDCLTGLNNNFYKYLQLKLVLLNLFDRSYFITDLFYDFVNIIHSENITDIILKDKQNEYKYNLYYLYTEFIKNNKHNKKIDLKILHTFKNYYSISKRSYFYLNNLETNYMILEELIGAYPKDLECEKSFMFWSDSYSLIESYPMVTYTKYIKADPEKFAYILRKYLKDTFEGNMKRQKKLKQQLFRIDRMLKDLNLDGINLVTLIDGFPDYFHSLALEILI